MKTRNSPFIPQVDYNTAHKESSMNNVSYDSIALWINGMISSEFNDAKDEMAGMGLTESQLRMVTYRLGVVEGLIKGRLMEHLTDKLGGRSW